MVEDFTTVLKIRSKSMPNFWVLPSATRRALNFSTARLLLRFTSNTKWQCIVLEPAGMLLQSTRSHVRSATRPANSLTIASCQYSAHGPVMACL